MPTHKPSRITQRTGPSDDAALIERLRAGDEAAFEAVVTAYHGSLTRLATTFVADRGTAEEVVQDTWVGVLKGLPAFEGRSSLKTWIFRILVNRARTRGQRDGRMLPFSAMGVEDEAAQEDRFTARGAWAYPPFSWRDQDPEQLLLGRESAAALDAAIAALPPNQRAVLTLRDIEGVSSGEACNILSIEETNQRVLLHRARTRIRAAIEAHLRGRDGRPEPC